MVRPCGVVAFERLILEIEWPEGVARSIIFLRQHLVTCCGGYHTDRDGGRQAVQTVYYINRLVRVLVE